MTKILEWLLFSDERKLIALLILFLLFSHFVEC